MVRAMCGVQHTDRIRATDLMSGWNEIIDLLAMAHSVHWYGHVLTSEDGHVMRWAFEYEVEGQRSKGR